MTCKQIKLPSFLPILPSSSPIPHSLLLPLTHSLPFSHPLSFPSPSLAPLFYPLPSHFSFRPFLHAKFLRVRVILNAKSLSSISHLNIFNIQISENIPSVFCHSSKDRVLGFLKLVNNQEHNKKSNSFN